MCVRTMGAKRNTQKKKKNVQYKNNKPSAADTRCFVHEIRWDCCDWSALNQYGACERRRGGGGGGSGGPVWPRTVCARCRSVHVRLSSSEATVSHLALSQSLSFFLSFSRSLSLQPSAGLVYDERMTNGGKQQQQHQLEPDCRERILLRTSRTRIVPVHTSHQRKQGT